MEQLLWTFEEIKAFTTHRDVAVRRWAVERLIKLFPDQAADVLVTMVDDDNSFIRGLALDFLAETADTEKYGPILLEHLQKAQGEQFGRLVHTLAKLEYRPALPVLLTFMKDRPSIDTLDDGWWLVEALGEFGGDEARQVLWQLLEQAESTDTIVVPAMGALLNAAQPEDIPRLVQYYRTLPPAQGWRTPLSEFASSVGAARLFGETQRLIEDGILPVLEHTAWWLNTDLPLSEACLDALEEAFEDHYEGVFEIYVQEANRLLTQRGDNLSAWQDNWENGERLRDYQRRTLYTLHILQVFADQPQTYLNRHVEECALGFALLAQLSIDRDDQAWLEAAPDKTEALLSILTDTREHVLVNVIDQVAALGPEIVPRLIDRLDQDDYSWGAIRVAYTLERIARLHPGSCDAAAPKLIECLYDDQGDFMKEAVSDVLAAIGPPAVDLINKHLRTTRDLSRQIFLTGVLGEIPVESAATVILTNLKAGRPIEEFDLITLSNIGSAAAIEPLYQLWKPGDHLLAEHLLILCELNDVEKPEIPEWRRLMIAEEERVAKLMSQDFDIAEAFEKLKNPQQSLLRTWQLEPDEPKPSSSGRKKGVSKKEQKKRAAQRKSAKRKRKKRR